MHMLALYRCGRQSEALRAFGRTRTASSRVSASTRRRSCRRWSGGSSNRTGHCSSASPPTRAAPRRGRGRRRRGVGRSGGSRTGRRPPGIRAGAGRRALRRHQAGSRGARRATPCSPNRSMPLQRGASDDRCADQGGDRRRRPGVRRRRTDRAAAGARRPARRRGQPRSGAVLAGRPPGAHRVGRGWVGGGLARTVRHHRVRRPGGRLPTRRPRLRRRVPAVAARPAAAVAATWRRAGRARLRAARPDRGGRARRGASRLPADDGARGGGAHLRPGDRHRSAVRAPLRDRRAADHPCRAPGDRPAVRLLARARPGGDGPSVDDRRSPRHNGSRRTAWPRQTRWSSSSRSPRRSPRRIATVWSTGGCGRRT